MAPESSTTSASSQPSQTHSSSNGIFTGNNSSNLYLVTFLATLFLLLFISSAIVLRSYILRRRFQRQIDEAIAAGFLPPRVPGLSPQRLGPKPKIYRAWVTQGGHKWNQMMPISALPVQVKRRNKNDPGTPSKIPSQQNALSSPQLPSPPPPPDVATSRLPGHRFFRAFRSHRQPTVEPQAPDREKLKPARTKIDMLQVSVLISMPSPSTSRPITCSTSSLGKSDDDENEDPIPDVVFGVTRLPYKQPAKLTTS